ncbi:hypothetical protein DFP72DRAFT_1080967 [Ephemerocybe angulata]|uniref:Uncharacterized protein n=1 Tax=Ephemerocybe angulata TaxID=980116 RepID=A0A8H6HBY1_9AGAR|nr:hypothetical protein DFP72DRAFT_1080967 [Tulosesus angulatus]
MPISLDLKHFMGTNAQPVPEEAHDAMLGTLTLKDLHALGSLRPLAKIIENHLMHRIRTLFASFHLPCRATLDIMGDTGSVVSGSAAMSIIIPGLRVPRDLNLYCPRGYAEEVVGYLKSQKYVIQPTNTTWNHLKTGNMGKYNINNGVHSLHRFNHLTHSSFITLVESAAASPLIPILFFHNTFLMNYYDARKVTCLYPELTFEMKGLHNRSSGFDRLHKQGLGLKWERLGVSLLWTCETLHDHQATATTTTHTRKPTECQRERRSMEDGNALNIQYDYRTSFASRTHLSWHLGFFKWETTCVDYHDTQVTAEVGAERTRYSNTKTARKVLDWRVYWGQEDENEGRTNVAETSFP